MEKQDNKIEEIENLDVKITEVPSQGEDVIDEIDDIEEIKDVKKIVKRKTKNKVHSVNAKSGDVILNSDDIPEGQCNLYLDPAKFQSELDSIRQEIQELINSKIAIENDGEIITSSESSLVTSGVKLDELLSFNIVATNKLDACNGKVNSLEEEIEEVKEVVIKYLKDNEKFQKDNAESFDNKLIEKHGELIDKINHVDLKISVLEESNINSINFLFSELNKEVGNSIKNVEKNHSEYKENNNKVIKDLTKTVQNLNERVELLSCKISEYSNRTFFQKLKDLFK